MGIERDDTQRDDRTAMPPDEAQRESGQFGGGKGRRDEVGRTPVYPASDIDEAPPDAVVRGQMEWGQGERGPAGYYDSGESEISYVGDTAIPGGSGAQGTTTPESAAGQSPSQGQSGQRDADNVSNAAPPSHDPTSPATDVLSGQV
jgi:hypothetical protein